MLPKKPSEGDAEPLRRTTRSRPQRCSPSSRRSPISWLRPSAATGTRLRQGRRACPEMPSVSLGSWENTHPGVRLAYYLRAIDGEAVVTIRQWPSQFSPDLAILAALRVRTRRLWAPLYSDRSCSLCREIFSQPSVNRIPDLLRVGAK